MLILSDQVTPGGYCSICFRPHRIKAKDQGWNTLSNGDLLIAAEQAGLDVVVTADKNMPYQQNLAGRRIAIVVLGPLSGQS